MQITEIFTVLIAASLATSMPVLPSDHTSHSSHKSTTEGHDMFDSSASGNLVANDTHPESVSLNQPKNMIECLPSNHMFFAPRFSIQFKGFCEEEYGQCFLRRLRFYGALISDWECWKRNDGWWQADFTQVDAYGLARAKINWVLADVTGTATDCE